MALKSKFENYVEVIQEHVKESPDKNIFIFLGENEQELAKCSFLKLHENAKAIAGFLKSKCKPGDRVLLIYPSGLEFVYAFLGCLYSGVVAVPVFPPISSDISERLRHIISDSGPILSLTDSLIISAIQTEQKIDTRVKFRSNDDMTDNKSPHKNSEISYQGTQIVNTEGLSKKWAHNYDSIDLNADSLAFLQYTSGSTGNPKGVMVTHGNLLSNEEMIRRSFGFTEKSIMAGWMPLYHDMGLIGNVLQPFYTGFPVVLMSPQQFLQDPISWLDIITRYKATCSGGPNFAYELCIRRATQERIEKLDLSSWELAFNGAEPIRPTTLERFSEVFKICGFRKEAFYPCYGLAESTLLAAGGEKTREPEEIKISKDSLNDNKIVTCRKTSKKSQSLISCGYSIRDQRLEIIDPESKKCCAQNEIGEIWLKGPSVAAGYWEKPELTREIFEAYTDNGDGPFLRTGDLGFMRKNELFITGRLKDIIIINGRNYYPQDIEYVVEKSHPNIRAGRTAAFSISNEIEEQLCIVAEFKGMEEALTDVITKIRYAIGHECGIKANIIALIEPKQIPVTSSGKIRHKAVKKAFLDGKFNILRLSDMSSNMSNNHVKVEKIDTRKSMVSETEENSITEQISILVAEKLRIDLEELDITVPLGQYGLTSNDAVELSLEFEILTGEAFAPTIVFEYPTIKQLSEYLNKQSAGEKDNELQKVFKKNDVAIIGLSCIFPGSSDPSRFWKNLVNKMDLIRPIPHSRDESKNKSSQTHYKFGGIIDGMGYFDAEFFGISSSEAISMDPQHRIFMETAWKAVEDSGYAPSNLSSSNTGVFVGVSSSDYRELSIINNFSANAYSASGIAHSMLANRLSYVLDIHGPSEIIDTACSSSLVAVHRAVKAIINGECDLAVAGGVNALLSPTLHGIVEKAGVLSKDGKCKTFDALANGYVRGEGAGAVLLKPAYKAIEDGDHIYAVIKGSAVNHDGRTISVSAPNENAQAALIIGAFENADITPDTITYIEAHGTGTVLGDPIEINGLKKAFNKLGPENTQKKHYCGIGSVKTNIGHLEAASGIAGLIKVILALKNKKLPASINFKKLNPYIKLNDSPFYIVEQTKQWENLIDQENNIIPLRAGVSSFGYGGANAHVVLEEYKNTKVLADGHSEPQVILLSAKTTNALNRYIHVLHDFVTTEENQIDDEDLRLSDIAYTLQTGRNHFSERIAFIVDSKSELREILSEFISGKPDFSKVVKGNSVRTQAGDLNQIRQLLKEKDIVKLAQLWIDGFEIDWRVLHDKKELRRLSLPTYQFERAYYWIEEAEIQRASVEQFDEKELTPLPITLEEAIIWLKDAASEYTDIPLTDINIEKSFGEIGMDSMALIDIFARIKADFQIKLPESAIKDCPNIDSLAKLMINGETGDLIDLEKEVIFDDAILPKNIKETYRLQKNHQVKHILLTGATGFLGIFLLRELVKNTDATIYCLIRAKDKQEGIRRIRDAIKKFMIRNCPLNKRVHILTGDLTEEKFGIDSETYENLSITIDTIYHCAAIVDWMKSYASLKKVNVSGTIETIKFAGHNTIKHLHYVSSLAVLPLTKDKYQWFETDIPQPDNLTNGYAQSKWVAEMHCKEAQLRGLPVNIFRFDFLVGAQKTGAMKETDFIVRLIKGCIQLGCIPVENTNFDIIAVDYLSKMLVEISKLNENKTYHLINRKPFTISDFTSLIRGFGYKLEKIPFETWKKLVEKSPSNVLYPLYPFLKQYTTAQLDHYYRSILDNTNTLTALYEIDPELISASPSAGDIMQQVISFFQKKAYLPSNSQEGVLKRQEKYWRMQLAGAAMRLDLPRERWANQKDQAQYIVSESFSIHDDLYEKIEKLAHQEGVSFSEILLSVYKIFLFRYCRETDIPVAVPVAHPVSLDTSGKNTHINKIPIIRTLLSENASFRTVLSEVKQTVSEAFANLDLSSDEIYSMIHSDTDSDEKLKYDCMFIFEDKTDIFRDRCRLTVGPLSYDEVWPEYDGIVLSIEKSEKEVTGAFRYDANLYSNNIITRMIRHFNTLLRQVIADSDVNVFNVPIMEEQELNQIIYEWNKTQANFPIDKCVHELFAMQVKRTPNAIAVSFEDKGMTYEELDKKSDQLAAYLHKHGVGSGDIVGICIERSFEMVIGLLSVLKSGSAYLPLDPTYPKKRLKYMIEDSGTKIVLSQSMEKRSLPNINIKVISLDEEWRCNEEITNEKNTLNFYETHAECSNPDKIVYLIYTSGSTGEPKAVEVRHRELVNLLYAMDNLIKLPNNGSMITIASLSFDMSVPDIFLPLIKGARIELVTRDTVKDGYKLKSFLEKKDITVMQATPATWQMLKYAEWKGNSSMVLISGGEALNRDLAQSLIKWSKSAYNGYGPTETTIYTTFKKLELNSKINIGKPIDNVQLYVLDKYLNPVPIGALGELYIGGKGLAKGYHNSPELTKSKFILNPFNNTSREKLYKTGDLVRYLPDGEIDYMGRIDKQVKIRGYRIELGEIESVLEQDKDIQKCITAVLEDGNDNKQIIAYIVPKRRNMLINISNIHERLKDMLPKFMLPGDYVVIEKLPLNPNGKIDRSLLPKPKSSNKANRYIAPKTPIEIHIADIWTKVLNVEKIGITDNFLEIGGNSVLAVKMLSEIKKQMNVNVKIRYFYDNLTISELAETVLKIFNNENISINEKEYLVELRKDALQKVNFDLKKLGKASDIPEGLNNIFLTGSTGFLGAYLLRSILEKTSADVYCLVRADSSLMGIKRIKKNLETYSLWKSEYKNRVKPVIGDLSQLSLGISNETFKYLARNIDAIYHCGSLVNFSYPYPFLKRSNVDGTIEVLKLASQVKVKPVFYISTIGVFESTEYKKNCFISENEELPEPDGLFYGYSQSKWVAEKIVSAAGQQGLPVSIFRPTSILGDSRTGASKLDDIINYMIRACALSGTIPDLDFNLDGVPVDYMSDSIVSISLNPKAIGGKFNMVSPYPISAKWIIDYIISAGYNLTLLPFDIWVEILQEVFKNDEILSPFMPILKNEISPITGKTYLEMQTELYITFSFDNVETFLPNYQRLSPPLDQKKWDRYLTYLEEVKYISTHDNRISKWS